MARFNLYVNPDIETRKLAPYLRDVQSTHVGILPTRIVTPPRPVRHLAFSPESHPTYFPCSRSTAKNAALIHLALARSP
jgi:hypothetical protein